jgi:hypothetical protein
VFEVDAGRRIFEELTLESRTSARMAGYPELGDL